jgi:hypothetical protein
MEGAGKDDIKKTREAPDEGVWNKIRGNGHRYAPNWCWNRHMVPPKVVLP